ncbi:MAG: tungstate ABC transporter substrate-binding protein WtpA [Bacteroidota bacterium]|nr:tungstate ABC transporter substrate-binding protein WtpA [Bacteroidota bacterium]
MRNLLFKSSFLILISLLVASCDNNMQKSSNIETNEKLIIFHAGSLTVPFKQIAIEFNEVYPNIEIVMEGAGSRKCARKITDLHKECDIMASADYTVIDKLLIPDFASWNIKFASNEMSIVYHEGSRYANEINADNWYRILMNDDVAYGRSDPNADPCGYRAVLTSKLAEVYYNEPGLAEKLLAKDQNYIRPKETDLLGLLESNAIDYIFLYRSVAEQHGLDFVLLPDSINLNKPELAGFYQQATVDISGKKPGEFITKKGEPMVYGVTIIDNAPNKSAALKFVDFLLHDEKGLAIMRKKGQPDVVPSPSNTYSNIPESLKQYATN